MVTGIPQARRWGESRVASPIRRHCGTITFHDIHPTRDAARLRSKVEASTSTSRALRGHRATRSRCTWRRARCRSIGIQETGCAAQPRSPRDQRAMPPRHAVHGWTFRRAGRRRRALRTYRGWNKHKMGYMLLSLTGTGLAGTLSAKRRILAKQLYSVFGLLSGLLRLLSLRFSSAGSWAAHTRELRNAAPEADLANPDIGSAAAVPQPDLHLEILPARNRWYVGDGQRLVVAGRWPPTPMCCALERRYVGGCPPRRRPGQTPPKSGFRRRAG